MTGPALPAGLAAALRAAKLALWRRERPTPGELAPFARRYGVPLADLCAGFGWLPALDRGPHGQALWVDVLSGPGTPREPATEGARAAWALFCRFWPSRDRPLFRVVLPISAAS